MPVIRIGGRRIGSLGKLNTRVSDKDTLERIRLARKNLISPIKSIKWELGTLAIKDNNLYRVVTRRYVGKEVLCFESIDNAEYHALKYHKNRFTPSPIQLNERFIFEEVEYVINEVRWNGSEVIVSTDFLNGDSLDVMGWGYNHLVTAKGIEWLG